MARARPEAMPALCADLWVMDRGVRAGLMLQDASGRERVLFAGSR
jgi:hypothetical protein